MNEIFKDYVNSIGNVPEHLERELNAQDEPNTPMLGEIEVEEDNRVDEE